MQAEQNFPSSPRNSTGIREWFSTLDDNVMLTETETAEVVGLKANTLRQWRYLGRGPEFVRLGGRACRYRVGTIRQWLSEASTAAA